MKTSKILLEKQDEDIIKATLLIQKEKCLISLIIVNQHVYNEIQHALLISKCKFPVFARKAIDIFIKRVKNNEIKLRTDNTLLQTNDFKKQMTFFVDNELRNKINDISARTGLTKNAVIVIALKETCLDMEIFLKKHRNI